MEIDQIVLFQFHFICPHMWNWMLKKTQKGPSQAGMRVAASSRSTAGEPSAFIRGTLA